jgi:hypothetical protein
LVDGATSREHAYAVSGAGGHGGPTSRGRATVRPGRVRYLDDLKTMFVAGVIVFHAVVSYATVGSWPYQDVQESQLSAPSEAVVVVIFGPPAFFLMGVFFLLSGLVGPGSVDRKGIARFVRDRLLRLGVPVVVMTVLVWPLLIAGLHRATGDASATYVFALVHATPLLDNGPLWFVEVLLIFSLGYAAWRRMHPHTATPDGVSGWTLVWLGAGIAAATFAVRVAFAVDTPQIANLHLWQWPQCLGLFALGIAAARCGWLGEVPSLLRHRAGVVALAVIPILPIVAAVAAAAGHPLDGDRFGGGWRWESALTATIEGALVVSTAVWILGFAQRHALPHPRLRDSAARAAYGAFLVQGPVLIALALLLRPIAAPAEIKAPLLATFGVVGSFASAWYLVARTPLGRLL